MGSLASIEAALFWPVWDKLERLPGGRKKVLCVLLLIFGPPKRERKEFYKKNVKVPAKQRRYIITQFVSITIEMPDDQEDKLKMYDFYDFFLALTEKR